MMHDDRAEKFQVKCFWTSTVTTDNKHFECQMRNWRWFRKKIV